LYGFNVGMTDEGIVRAAVLMGSIVQAIVIATVFSVTTEPGSLTKALTRLGRDMRMQSLEKVGFTLTLGLRFVPMIQWEVRNVMEAQKARGGDFGRTSVMSRIRASAAALVPAIRIATARADRLAAAMVTRGFQFGKPRTEYKPLRMKYPDYAALMVLLGLLVLKLIFSGAA
jgi:energy-coupling factor transport system permease protein